jgi:intein/homing endonuclease
VVCNDINNLHDYFWEGYEGKGEPYGLINLKLSRKIGRLGETQYPDPEVMEYNPCVVGDTQVEVMIDGKNDTIRVKDLVDLFNERKDILIKSYTGSKQEYAPLTAAWLTKKDASLIRVSDTVSGKSLICTPDHKIFTHTRGYIRADELQSDDILELT